MIVATVARSLTARRVSRSSGETDDPLAARSAMAPPSICQTERRLARPERTSATTASWWGLDDGRDGLGVGEDPADLLGGGGLVDRDDDPAGCPDREKSARVHS